MVFLRLLDLTVLDLDIRVFQGFGSFRLLIQRCKTVREKGNFFDKGRVLPDESTRAPGEGILGFPSEAKGTTEKKRGTKLRRRSERGTKLWRSSEERCFSKLLAEVPATERVVSKQTRRSSARTCSG